MAAQTPGRTPTARQLKAEIDSLKTLVEELKATVKGLEMAIAAYKRVGPAPYVNPWDRPYPPAPPKVEPYKYPEWPWQRRPRITFGGINEAKPGEPGTLIYNHVQSNRSDVPTKVTAGVAHAARG